MDVQFKGKNMLHYSRGVKRQQGFTTGDAFYVYNVISLIFEMVHRGHGSPWSSGFHARNPGGLGQKVLFWAS